jgi:hypothetical protein
VHIDGCAGPGKEERLAVIVLAADASLGMRLEYAPNAALRRFLSQSCEGTFLPSQRLCD